MPTLPGNGWDVQIRKYSEQSLYPEFEPIQMNIEMSAKQGRNIQEILEPVVVVLKADR